MSSVSYSCSHTCTGGDVCSDTQAVVRAPRAGDPPPCRWDWRLTGVWDVWGGEGAMGLPLMLPCEWNNSWYGISVMQVGMKHLPSRACALSLSFRSIVVAISTSTCWFIRRVVDIRLSSLLPTSPYGALHVTHTSITRYTHTHTHTHCNC